MGSIYGSHPVGLLYFIGTWTLDPHLKWPLFFHVQMQIIQSQIKRLGSRTGSNDNRPGLSWMGEVRSITRNRHVPKQSKSTGEVFQNVNKFNQIYTKKKKKISQFFWLREKQSLSEKNTCPNSCTNSVNYLKDLAPPEFSKNEIWIAQDITRKKQIGRKKFVGKIERTQHLTL
jgi:hypothetical protein